MMKRTHRNLMLALGLATSLVLPGLALADNWHGHAQQYSPKQRPAQRHDTYRNHARDHHRGYEFADRDDFRRHEWREHRRWHRIERHREYRHHEWREHARRYYRLHRYYGYGVYPGAFVARTYLVPTPRLVIDLH
jgi:hypothetical protein